MTCIAGANFDDRSFVEITAVDDNLRQEEDVHFGLTVLKASSSKQSIQVTSVFDLTKLGICPLTTNINCFVVGRPERSQLHGNLKWVSYTNSGPPDSFVFHTTNNIFLQLSNICGAVYPCEQLTNYNICERHLLKYLQFQLSS